MPPEPPYLTHTRTVVVRRYNPAYGDARVQVLRVRGVCGGRYGRRDMKVIQEGCLPADKVLRGRCPHCGCLVECTRGEAKDNSDPREPGWFVRCPTRGCGCEIKVGA